MARKLPQIQRFWLKVKRGCSPDSCWEWMGYKNPKGYGQTRWGGVMTYAHRLAWTLYKMTIPEKLHVLHKCDNPGCVNPDHLFLGTNSDNMKDMVIKGREAKGEGNGKHKLTEANVVFIRSHRALFTQHEFGAMFSVRYEAIGRVLRGESWKHLPEIISTATVANVANAVIAPSETRMAEQVSQN